VTSCIIFSRPY